MSNPKKPAAKVKAPLYNPTSFYNDQLALDDELKAELAEKGLSYKFINAQEFAKRGSHKSHWVPYKREKKVENSSFSKIYGTDPEGFVRRGDLILAVKTMEQADAHRDFLRQRSQQLSTSVDQQAAEELKRTFRNAGVKAKILTGYDGEEE